jgi:hypothetical protein
MRRDTAVTMLWVGLTWGCGFDSGGVGSGSGIQASTDSADSTSTSSDAGTSTTDAPGATTTTTGGTQDTAAETTGVDATGDTGSKGLPGSCSELLANEPGTPSGVYFIAPPRSMMPVVPFRVYCDMEMAGGGWTLVARSISGDHDPGGYGWESRRGNIDDDTVPYSLGVTAAGIEFDEIVVGNRSDAKAWGTHVYRLGVPADFVEAHTNTAVHTTSVQTELGSCAPEDGPSNLGRVGFTVETAVYFFDSGDGFAAVGLTPTGFDLPHTACPCSCSGNLQGDQGMIMVR